MINSPIEASADTTVVVRTHGVGASVYRSLEATGADICDATCPFVKKIHRIVARIHRPISPCSSPATAVIPRSSASWVTATASASLSATPKNFVNFENHPEYSEKKITVVSQTTFSVKEWQESLKIIKILCTNANVFDTICNATQDRQKEASELSQRSI